MKKVLSVFAIISVMVAFVAIKSCPKDGTSGRCIYLNDGKVLPEKCPYWYIKQSDWEQFFNGVLDGDKWIIITLPTKPDRKSGKKQTLVAYEGTEKYLSALVSAAATDECCPPGVKPIHKKHNHLGLFRVRDRLKKCWSSLYTCTMRWCLFYHRSHGVHAAHSDGIAGLGRPNSGGCNRTYPKIAKKLFVWGWDFKVRPIWVLVVRT